MCFICSSFSNILYTRSGYYLPITPFVLCDNVSYRIDCVVTLVIEWEYEKRITFIIHTTNILNAKKSDWAFKLIFISIYGFLCFPTLSIHLKHDHLLNEDACINSNHKNVIEMLNYSLRIVSNRSDSPESFIGFHDLKFMILIIGNLIV